MSVENGISRRRLLQVAAGSTAVFLAGSAGTPSERPQPGTERLKGEVQSFVADMARLVKSRGDEENGKDEKARRFTFNSFKKRSKGDARYSIKSIPTENNPSLQLTILVDGKMKESSSPGAPTIDPAQIESLLVLKEETFRDGHTNRTELEFKRSGDNNWEVLKKTDTHAETVLDERDGEVSKDNSSTNGSGEKKLTSDKFAFLSKEANELIGQALS